MLFRHKTYDLYKFNPGRQELKVLCDLLDKNREVADLLRLLSGDEGYSSTYSCGYIFGALCFTKVLLNNLNGYVDRKIKESGVLKRTILNGVPISDAVKKRIKELPLDTNAKDVIDCFKKRGFYFHNYTTKKYVLNGIHIRYKKIVVLLKFFENFGPNCSVESIQNTIKEIDEILNTMIARGLPPDGEVFNNFCFDKVKDAIVAEEREKIREEVKKELIEADAITDNTQTLTLNRPKQQENKIITVGNKKAYQVGKGDYKHRNGRIIEGEKKEMNKVYTYPVTVSDKNILADLEDLLNNIIDNPDTVDELVNYLEKNSPAAHFISEMIGCSEIDDEESLIGALNKATSVSQGMIAAGKNVRVQGGEYKVFNYLNIDYPKPVFGREFSLKQLSFCFDVAAREIEDIFVKAKAEEEAEEALEEVIADAAQAQAKEIEDILDSAEEEKEEVIANETVQEHTEEDCEPHAQDHRDYDDLDFEELTKLVEERRKKAAEQAAELKRKEEIKRRKALIDELCALDKLIEEQDKQLAEYDKGE